LGNRPRALWHLRFHRLLCWSDHLAERATGSAPRVRVSGGSPKSLLLWTRAQPNRAPIPSTLPDIDPGGLITSIPPPSQRVSVAQTGLIVAVYVTMQDGRLLSLRLGAQAPRGARALGQRGYLPAKGHIGR
jgi:hypothetical protein